MTARTAGTRVVVGRAGVVQEIRTAAPLLAALRAPVTARAPWLTAVLNQGVPAWSRSTAVVVTSPGQAGPAAVAFLSLRRRGPTTVVSMLGNGTKPLPGGRPTARLPARDEAAAARLAEGLLEMLGTLRGPWRLELAGLPLGDPTARALAARLPTSVLANVRSSRLVDELDDLGATPPARSRDPRVLERWLPALLGRCADARARGFLGATARLHAAIGQVEVAVVAEGDVLRAGLLTLVDGEDRWPWWGCSDVGGLRTEMGAPLAGLSARGWSSRSALSPGAGR